MHNGKLGQTMVGDQTVGVDLKAGLLAHLGQCFRKVLPVNIIPIKILPGAPPGPLAIPIRVHHTCLALLSRQSDAAAETLAKVDGKRLPAIPLFIGAASSPVCPPALAPVNDKVMVCARYCSMWR